MDKIVGAFFIVVVLAMVAIGSFTAYAMFGQNPQTSDTYGNRYTNKTNATVAVENAVAPVSISITGYLVLIAAIFIVVGVGAVVFKAVTGGGFRSVGGLR